MTEKDFLPKLYANPVESGSFTWQAPSNIALVKYWGKRNHQIPENPSLSFTLNNCKTITELSYSTKMSKDEYDFEVYLDGKLQNDFKPKIETFFTRIEQYVPFIKKFKFKLETTNTFPHSSGIASSASGMSALSLCIVSLEQQLLREKHHEDYFNRKASFLARLGSGSACRSIEGDLILWGKCQKIAEGSDLYGIKVPFEVHENFKNYNDTILLIDKGQKQVSSTVGHNLMHGHPFSKERFLQAEDNIYKLMGILMKGELSQFISIVEHEALTLHAMMMTSNPYFILMKPNTLTAINRIWEYRKESGSSLCFTLDAGANVHVLYPESETEKTIQFIKNELVELCENNQFIQDKTGFGATMVL